MKTLESQWDDFKKKNHVLSVDMSKTFDTISNKKYLQILEEHSGDDEVRMVRYHMASTTSCVKIGVSYGEELRTNIGAPQGDCLSSLHFII